MPVSSTQQKLTRLRRGLLFVAAMLAITLFSVDRYATHMYRPSADSKEVVLYTTTWCGYCAALRRDLTASNVPYTEHDVEKSLRGWLGMWAMRGRGVPVSAIGPKIVHGYDVAQIAGGLRDIGYTYMPAQ